MIGIYKIVNLNNSKLYIGKSNNLDKRKYEHLNNLRRGIHCNSHLQYAFNKYGESNFKFVIIESYDSCSDDFLSRRENYWINYYGGVNSSNLYNLVDGNRGGTISEEVKQKISKSNKQIYKDPIRRKEISNRMTGRIKSDQENKKHSLAMKGKSKSIEWIEHMREVSKGNSYGKGYKHTEEAKLKIGKASKGRHHSAETKNKISNSRKGIKMNKIFREKISANKKNNIWINNSVITKFIRPSELDFYLAQGFNIGRGKLKKEDTYGSD